MESSVVNAIGYQGSSKCDECHKDCQKNEFTVCQGCVSKKVDASEKAHTVAVRIGHALPKKSSLMPKCPNCEEEYDLAGNLPKKLKCGHSVCNGCAEGIYQNECDNVSRCDYVPCLVCQYETPVTKAGPKCLPVNVEITAEMSRIAKEIKREEEASFVVCTQCAKLDIEQDMHICRDCTIQKHKVDVASADLKLPSENIDDYAICSTCVLKSHVIRAHKIVPFYPLRASSQIVSCRTGMATKANELDAKIEQVNLLWDSSSKIISRTKKELDRMMGMMVRCPSSVTRAAVERVFNSETKQAISYVDTLVKTMDKLNDDQMEHIKALNIKNAQFQVYNCPSQPTKAASQARTIVSQNPIAMKPPQAPLPKSQLFYQSTGPQQIRVQAVQKRVSAGHPVLYRPQPQSAPSQVRTKSGAVLVSNNPILGVAPANPSLAEQYVVNNNLRNMQASYRQQYLPPPRVLFPNVHDEPAAKLRK